MSITKTSPAATTPASVATNAARSTSPARDSNAVAVATPTKAAATAGESVSVSKVAQMRAAIESGTFKVDAGKIADGLIRSGDLAR